MEWANIPLNGYEPFFLFFSLTGCRLRRVLRSHNVGYKSIFAFVQSTIFVCPWHRYTRTMGTRGTNGGSTLLQLSVNCNVLSALVHGCIEKGEHQERKEGRVSSWLNTFNSVAQLCGVFLFTRPALRLKYLRFPTFKLVQQYVVISWGFVLGRSSLSWRLRCWNAVFFLNPHTKKNLLVLPAATKTDYLYVRRVAQCVIHTQFRDGDFVSTFPVKRSHDRILSHIERNSMHDCLRTNWNVESLTMRGN